MTKITLGIADFRRARAPVSSALAFMPQRIKVRNLLAYSAVGFASAAGVNGRLILMAAAVVCSVLAVLLTMRLKNKSRPFLDGSH